MLEMEWMKQQERLLLSVCSSLYFNHTAFTPHFFSFVTTNTYVEISTLDPLSSIP